MGVPASAKLVYGINLGEDSKINLTGSIHTRLLERSDEYPNWTHVAEGLFEDEGISMVSFTGYGSPHYGHQFWILGCDDLYWSTCDFEVAYPAAPRGILAVHNEKLEQACELLGVPYSRPAWILAVEIL